MTWKLGYTGAQATLKHLRQPDSSRLLLPRFGWREKTIISFATAILLATSAVAQMPAPYTLTLSLFNDARVPQSIVNSAEETASRIFAQSGIELHWLPCGREEESVEEQRACIQTRFPEHLHVHIVNSNPRLKGSVFGISYSSADGIGSQADVFYTKIASFHSVSSVEPGTLLGHAMAHELGHLLLGSNSHSLTGLMCANWRTKDLIHMEQGGLLFSEEQSLKMKAKLSTFAMQKDTGLHAVPSGRELPFRTYRDYPIVVQGSLAGKLRRNLSSSPLPSACEYVNARPRTANCEGEPMKTRLGNGLVLGFPFTARLAWAGRASAVSTDEGKQITILVYDYAQAGWNILLDAERVADGIFKNAGVPIAWLACSADKTAAGNSGCADLSGPLKITVRIEPDFMATKLRQKSDVFGLAAGIEEGEFPRDVWIFYDQAKELAVDKKLILPQILGSVIAHELGHLLLGANCHSTSGLMRAVWSREELLAANLGGLHFSNSERTRIQNSVFARHQAQRLKPNKLLTQRAHGRNEIPFDLRDCFLIVVEGRMLHSTG